MFLARFELIYTYVTMSNWHCCLILLLLYMTVISGLIFRAVHNLLKQSVFWWRSFRRNYSVSITV